MYKQYLENIRSKKEIKKKDHLKSKVKLFLFINIGD